MSSNIMRSYFKPSQPTLSTFNISLSPGLMLIPAHSTYTKQELHYQETSACRPPNHINPDAVIPPGIDILSLWTEHSC